MLRNFSQAVRLPMIAACGLLLVFSLAAAQDLPAPSVGEARTTPIARIRTVKGFRVELLYAVPPAEHGSWINLCTDDKGRILVSDQYGGLYRFAPPLAGAALDPATIQKVPAPVKAVNGMVWAFGALYVAVNDYENKLTSGLYRVTDSDGDDQLDRVELLRALEGRGDHATHAIVPTPDGQSLFLITGNVTKQTETATSRVPRFWGEDHLLPTLPDSRYRQRDVLAPGGIIYRVSPDGKTFEIVSTGYRNIFDAAVNRDGELFTFDSDDEGDMNAPWYRPARVCHVVSGSEFGWRNGAGKRPEWYPDNLPPVINIGPGSPTGMTFGYGAKFPARYQNALFVLDWSWGKLYAVHMQPVGATYHAEKEEFLSGAPLALTDAIIHPRDGAMYFTTGGRKIESGLYRVTYVGDESTAPAPTVSSTDPHRALRRQLEDFHGRQDPLAVPTAWPLLNHSDRFIRWAARTALEHQPVSTWAEQALTESDPRKQGTALLGLARAAGIDPQHRRPNDPPVDALLGRRILASLVAIPWQALEGDDGLTALRAIQIALVRLGRPDESTVQQLITRLDPLFPATTPELNWLLCETLVYLQSPSVAAKGVALLASAATQEEQMACACSLRLLRAGWTPDLRVSYFKWLLKAASSLRGGASFEKFIEFIRNDAIATLSDAEKLELATVLSEKPIPVSPLEGLTAMFAGRPKTEWTLDELSIAAESGLRTRSFENGRKMFAAAACFTCHRFQNAGGMTGPDLSSAGRRYSPRDLLDHTLHPNKEINEQYVPLVIATEDGETFQGLVVNLKADSIEINTDPTDPSRRTTIDRKQITSLAHSKVSPMPSGLLAQLTKDEILDLVAYIMSGGDAANVAFQNDPQRLLL